jgi:hypothetical protein
MIRPINQSINQSTKPHQPNQSINQTNQSINQIDRAIGVAFARREVSGYSQDGEGIEGEADADELQDGAHLCVACRVGERGIWAYGGSNGWQSV